MKILVACEESQAVTKELRKLGHEAYSNDIIETSGDNPEWHLQVDLKEILNDDWDMIIAFPPCTYLTNTGARWFNIERYGEKAIQRHKDREVAIDFFMNIVNAKCDKIAIENPVGIMSTVYQKPTQIINPFEFGDPYQKRTCLWLKNLPKLKPTNIVEPEPRIYYPSGKSLPAWYANANAKTRSKTFPGIAKAMAQQWGGEVECTQSNI